MTGDQRKFIKLKKKEKGKVTFGDNVSAKILGKGIVILGNNIMFHLEGLKLILLILR
jgi:hypothetical protein